MKTALITGGTSGIGLSIAKALLQKEYKVYLIGRNSEKGKAIESALDAQYQLPHGNHHGSRQNCFNQNTFGKVRLKRD